MKKNKTSEDADHNQQLCMHGYRFDWIGLLAREPRAIVP